MTFAETILLNKIDIESFLGGIFLSHFNYDRFYNIYLPKIYCTLRSVILLV